MLGSLRIVGHDRAIALLQQAVAKRHIAPAYLITGPGGIGRSLVVRYFAKLLLGGAAHKIDQGNHPDLLWVQPTYLHQGNRISVFEAVSIGYKSKSPPVIRIEQIREIIEFLGRSPLESSRQVVVLEEAQTMAEATANALLKTLEEPGRATLLLIATGVDNLLNTIVSRCQRIPLHPLNPDQMAQVLASRPEILADPVIMSLAQGSPGAAIAAWQQLQNLPAELKTYLGQFPDQPLAAMHLARDIDKSLSLEEQLWLVDYLQHSHWQHPSITKVETIARLETAKEYLNRYVQPRLVWEVTLLSFTTSIG